jgi:diamine N-acetyltransferase
MIYSKRLRLRGAEREDIPRFVSWLNDPDVYRHLLLAYPLSQAAEEQWFQSMLARGPAEQVLVIETRIGDVWSPIGNTSFMRLDWVNRNAEIGIFIGEKSQWNQGYGREAMKLMLRHGFNNMNLHRIYLRVHANNPGAIKAYEATGFIHEGVLRQEVYRNGNYLDVLIMAVLQTEWQDSDF